VRHARAAGLARVACEGERERELHLEHGVLERVDDEARAQLLDGGIGGTCGGSGGPARR
jgi:hypothetical protein